MGELVGVIPGMALDLTDNDVDGNPEKRARAEKFIRDRNAVLYIGGIQCVAQLLKYKDLTSARWGLTM